MWIPMWTYTLNLEREVICGNVCLNPHPLLGLLSANFLIVSMLTLLGLSMGRPRARSQINWAMHPSALLTPKMTV